jgi:hypothetical protein
MADLDQQQMERGSEKGANALFGDKHVMAGEEVNASGHRDQLQRQYSIWSICGLALTIDNAWVALGGSVVVAVGMKPLQSAIANLTYLQLLTALQPMAVLRVSCTSIWPRAHTMVLLLHASLRYASLVSSLIRSHNISAPFSFLRSFDFITSFLFFFTLHANLPGSLQLASAVPSAGGVYHWASLTPGPKWGRVIGFFAGWISFFGWIFDFAAIIQITANVAVALYSVYHPDLVIQPWHVYVAYLLILWLCVAIVIFGNRSIPYLQDLGLFLVLVGGLVTIIVVAAMPQQHATNSFVWTDWVNSTGWSDGVAFLAGVLNGAFAIGTPDAITHMAEELPNPKRDLPRAVAAQIILGTLSMFTHFSLGTILS